MNVGGFVLQTRLSIHSLVFGFRVVNFYVFFRETS